MNERSIDMASGAILCGIAFFLMRQLDGIPREGVLLPMVVLWALVACGLCLAATAFFHGKKRPVNFFGDLNARHFVIVVVLFLVSVYTSLYFSFFMTMFCMCLCVTTALAQRRDANILAANAFFSAAAVVLIYLFFTKLMHVQFPEPFLA